MRISLCRFYCTDPTEQILPCVLLYGFPHTDFVVCKILCKSSCKLLCALLCARLYAGLIVEILLCGLLCRLRSFNCALPCVDSIVQIHRLKFIVRKLSYVLSWVLLCAGFLLCKSSWAKFYPRMPISIVWIPCSIVYSIVCKLLWALFCALSFAGFLSYKSSCALLCVPSCALSCALLCTLLCALLCAFSRVIVVHFIVCGFSIVQILLSTSRHLKCFVALLLVR